MGCECGGELHQIHIDSGPALDCAECGHREPLGDPAITAASAPAVVEAGGVLTDHSVLAEGVTEEQVRLLEARLGLPYAWFGRLCDGQLLALSPGRYSCRTEHGLQRAIGFLRELGVPYSVTRTLDFRPPFPETPGPAAASSSSSSAVSADSVVADAGVEAAAVRALEAAIAATDPALGPAENPAADRGAGGLGSHRGCGRGTYPGAGGDTTA